MAVTKKEIREWLDGAVSEGGITHMLVVCDTFSHEDYPVFVREGEDVGNALLKHSTDMQRVMEVYSLGFDLDEQLNEVRAWTLAKAPIPKAPRVKTAKRGKNRKSASHPVMGNGVRVLDLGD